jgi:hypothetical protein
MKPYQIVKIQKRIGTTPDGFWGPKSVAACKKHLRAMMPDPNPWPASDQASLRAFYGKPGDESNLVTFQPAYPLFYGGKKVSGVRCHKKVAESLARVLESIEKLGRVQPDIMDEAQDYSGCYNFRLKRGGSTYSLHAWGAAIDLDADDNTFKDSWPMKADMPLEIMECFAKEGWISAGAFWGYDAMHFEASKR